MSHEARSKSIHEWSTKPEKNILIASLQAGGLGLNLTAATKVLMIDPWWNSSVENQAFARYVEIVHSTRNITDLEFSCYRIGQSKETTLVKLVVKNTIDQAMMAVKERKQIEIDDCMNSSKMKEKLNVEDLLRLFGKVEEDEEGVPFIFADEPEDEHLRLANVDDEDEMGFMGNDE
jgi:SNF2 family DNA or RNA helicase